MPVYLLVAVALFLACFIAFVWYRGRRYRAVFRPDHIREFILCLQPLGVAALTRLGTPIVDEDPRMTATSQGVILSYTVEPRNEIFVHRLMLQHAPGPTTYAVARRFLAAALLIYDPDENCKELAATPERLFVAEWYVGQEQQAGLNGRGYALPPGRDDEEIRSFLDRAEARATRLAQLALQPALDPGTSAP